jgi:Mrp family chromosome partitioning ATPase
MDTAPLLGFAETLDLVPSADAAVVVAEAGQTDIKAIAIVMNALRRLNIHVGGLVLNKASSKHMGYQSSYYRTYEKYYLSSLEA